MEEKMFLTELKYEEKQLFLNLCIHAANANDFFVEEEKNMIQDYCREMKIEEPSFLEMKSLEAVIAEINRISDLRSKKIIVLELLGLMMVDKEYDEHEKIFMKTLAEKIGIEKDLFNEIAEKLDKYLQVCNELQEAVLE